MHWNRGAQIAIREHWNNKVWTVRPVTVVADTPEVIALYMMPGTIYKHPRAIDGSPVPHFLPDAWVLIDTQWRRCAVSRAARTMVCDPGLLWRRQPAHRAVVCQSPNSLSTHRPGV